jgi:hypothetical protein
MVLKQVCKKYVSMLQTHTFLKKKGEKGENIVILSSSSRLVAAAAVAAVVKEEVEAARQTKSTAFHMTIKVLFITQKSVVDTAMERFLF